MDQLFVTVWLLPSLKGLFIIIRKGDKRKKKILQREKEAQPSYTKPYWPLESLSHNKLGMESLECKKGCCGCHQVTR